MTETATYSDAVKVECLKREVSQRKRVYARLVAQGKMTQPFADRQIAIMEAILDDYRDALPKDLFAEGMSA